MLSRNTCHHYFGFLSNFFFLLYVFPNQQNYQIVQPLHRVNLHAPIQSQVFRLKQILRRTVIQSNPENYYTLRVTKEQRIPKFNTTALHYQVDVKNLDVRDLPDIVKTFAFPIYKAVVLNFGMRCSLVTLRV
jgi:hypothetical protein